MHRGGEFEFSQGAATVRDEAEWATALAEPSPVVEPGDGYAPGAIAVRTVAVAFNIYGDLLGLETVAWLIKYLREVGGNVVILGSRQEAERFAYARYGDLHREVDGNQLLFKLDELDKPIPWSTPAAFQATLEALRPALLPTTPRRRTTVEWQNSRAYVRFYAVPEADIYDD